MTDKNYDGTPTEVSFGIGYCAMRLAMTRSIYEENLVKNEFSKNAWISFNKNNVINYDNDPFCGYVPTNGFYKEFLKGLSSIQKKENIKNISKKLQILIIGGEYDAVSNNAKGLKSLQRLYKKYGLDSKLIIYEDMRHEILNEEEHKKVYQDIIEFLE